MLADMRLSPSGALKLFAAASPDSQKQRRKFLVLLLTSRQRTRISVGDEKSLADNLLQKTAKTASLPCVVCTVCWAFASHKWIKNEHRPRSVGGLRTGPHMHAVQPIERMAMDVRAAA